MTQIETLAEHAIELARQGRRSNMNDNLEVALELARMGFYVFPCQSEGAGKKAPCRGVMWRSASTNDEREVRSLWHKHPDAVPGIDLGRSGLFAIDCDRKLSDGRAWFEAYAAKHDDILDNVPTVDTPSGGRHYYFKNKFDPAQNNGRGGLPEKSEADIDVRGEAGYTIAPGAVFTDGSGSYRANDISIVDAPEAPQWLADLLRPVRAVPALPVPSPASIPSEPVSDARKAAYGEATLDNLLRELADAPDGDRNNTANRVGFRVGQLVGGGCLTPTSALAALERTALDAWGIKPRDKALGPRGTFARALKDGEAHPRGPDDGDAPAVDISALLASEGSQTSSDAEIVQIGDWAEEHQDDPDPLIADHKEGSIIGRAEKGFLYGKRGTGKTALLNAFLLGISRGTSLSEACLAGEPLFKCKPGRVLIAVYETQRDYRRRMRAIAKHHGVDLRTLDWGSIPADLNITDPKSRKIFIKRIERDAERNGKSVLIVIDTVGAAVGGQSLNDDAVTGEYLALGTELLEKFGATVIFSAHPGKDDSKGLTGSLRQENNADFILKAVKGGDGRLRLMKDKDKGGESGRLLFEYTLAFIEVDKTTDGAPVKGAILGSVIPLVPDAKISSTGETVRDTTPRSIKILRAALAEVVLANGVERNPLGDDFRVKTVPADDVRAEFSARYPADTANAKRKAFKKALSDAMAMGIVGFREIEGRDHLWIAKTK